MSRIVSGRDILRFPLASDIWRSDGYARYGLDSAQRLKLLSGRLQDAAARPGETVCLLGHLDANDQLDGVMFAERFSMGEDCFGIGMVHVQSLLVSSENGGSVGATDRLGTLYRAFLLWARDHAISHLACRVAVENRPVIDFFESMGLQPVDALVRHLVRPENIPVIPRLKTFHGIRPYETADGPSVQALCIDRFTSSRFATDPNLPKEGKNRFFGIWAHRICDGRMSDRIWVATDVAGRVVGFMGWRTQQDLLRHLDIKVAGEGLGAVAPYAVGAYIPLLRNCIIDAASGHDDQGPKRPIQLAELETQTQRREVIKVWDRFGIVQAQAFKTYHHWLDV